MTISDGYIEIRYATQGHVVVYDGQEWRVGTFDGRNGRFLIGITRRKVVALPSNALVQKKRA